MLDFFLYLDHEEEHEGDAVPDAVDDEEEKGKIKDYQDTVSRDEIEEREILCVNEGCGENRGLRAGDPVEEWRQIYTMDQEWRVDGNVFLDGPPNIFHQRRHVSLVPLTTLSGS